MIKSKMPRKIAEHADFKIIINFAFNQNGNRS